MLHAMAVCVAPRALRALRVRVRVLGVSTLYLGVFELPFSPIMRAS